MIPSPEERLNQKLPRWSIIAFYFDLHLRIVIGQSCSIFCFFSQKYLFLQIKKDGPAVNPLVVEAAKEKESTEAAKEKEKKDEEEKKENKPLDDLFRYQYITQQITLPYLCAT